MASYDDFDALVLKLKKSAIDGYMRENRWDIDGDNYEQNASSAHYKVTKPDADGNGGGEWSSDNFIANWLTDKSDEYKGYFDEIRSTIDDLTKPWRDLPDPAGIGAHTENARQTTRRLAVNASSEGGESSGAGIIGGLLTLIDQNMEHMDGEAMATFKAKFLVQLRAVISGFHNITLVRGANVAAQEGLWEAARTDVTKIVSNSEKAFRALAENGSDNAEEVLTVVGFAAKGASLFGGGIPAGVVGLGVDILTDVNSKQLKPKVSASSYEDGISTLKSALEDLNEGITAEETLLDENFVTNLTNIAADKTSYDLTITPVTSTANIAINVQKVRDVARSYMPQISAELDAVSTISQNISLYSVVSRDDAIGIGQNGPSENLRELTWLLYELMRDLSWEITNGAKNLELVAEDFEHHEQQTASDLAAIGTKIDQGSGYTPWN